MNPLLSNFDTTPFSEIKTEHFLPALEEHIRITHSEIDSICENTQPPTFKNTVEALANTGLQVHRIASIFFNLNGADTNEDIQKLAQEISPVLTKYNNDLLLNEKLFDRVRSVYEQKESFDLSPEQSMLLERQYKSFARNGANLSDTEKDKLREIDEEIAKLQLTFGENVLAETNSFEMLLTNKDDLDGLPDDIVEAAGQLAAERGKEGWVFTLDYPSYIPFITYSNKRELRKKMALAFGSRAFGNNDHNNEEFVLKIVKLRHQRANLLGYSNHAHFVLEERMAKNPDGVNEFLQDLLEKAIPAANAELDKLTAFAHELDGLEKLQKWDGPYYSEKLKKQILNLDDELLKPYFQLENVIEGVFSVAGKLYGLHFRKNDDIDTYHQDVVTYDVLNDKDELLSILYTDFHPRPGKRAGAWMTSYKRQFKLNGHNERPHVSIVCNFTKPTATKPSLLTFDEVRTLFHEFGHALHGMLANTTYAELSGTNVYWDFVELPSQIMENWCYQPEALELFAKHYESGETIPSDLVKRVKDSATFLEGMKTIRQLSLGQLDMAWHSVDPDSIGSVKEFEERAFEGTQLYPKTPETCMSTSFSHIFHGGYSAGYYSYKWAEVLDADAFEYFLQEGIFNPGVAAKFKDHILSQGGSEDPMELYERFRGKKPDPGALLRRAGLVSS